MNADEIVKTLQAQFDKMRGAYEVMSALAEVRKEEIESLQAQLADERRRADAAVEDLILCCDCRVCRKRRSCVNRQGTHKYCYEWRGWREDDVCYT